LKGGIQLPDKEACKMNDPSFIRKHIRGCNVYCVFICLGGLQSSLGIFIYQNIEKNARGVMK